MKKNSSQQLANESQGKNVPDPLVYSLLKINPFLLQRTNCSGKTQQITGYLSFQGNPTTSRAENDPHRNFNDPTDFSIFKKICLFFAKNESQRSRFELSD